MNHYISRTRLYLLVDIMAVVLTLAEIMEFVEFLTEEKTCSKFVV